MANKTHYHHCVLIVHDGDDMFPHYIPLMAERGKKCRFRTLPAAKAAITRHLVEIRANRTT